MPTEIELRCETIEECYELALTDQTKRLKELEQENSKLKQLVAELSLDRQILQDFARGKF